MWLAGRFSGLGGTRGRRRLMMSAFGVSAVTGGKEAGLRYGFLIPTGGPREVAELAREAEGASWDGAFYWDGIAIGEMDTYDPWVVMAAMAMRTERVRIGAMLTPPARRRPWKLARETMTLDHLSGGRLVLPVGLGATDDGGFSKVGESTRASLRWRFGGRGGRGGRRHAGDDPGDKGVRGA